VAHPHVFLLLFRHNRKNRRRPQIRNTSTNRTVRNELCSLYTCREVLEKNRQINAKKVHRQPYKEQPWTTVQTRNTKLIETAHVDSQVIDYTGISSLDGNVAYAVVRTKNDGNTRNVINPVIIFVVLERNLPLRAENRQGHY